jgi:hypothetical protein
MAKLCTSGVIFTHATVRSADLGPKVDPDRYQCDVRIGIRDFLRESESEGDEGPLLDGMHPLKRLSACAADCRLLEGSFDGISCSHAAPAITTCPAP